MKKLFSTSLILISFLAACTVQPGDQHKLTADEEFAKLDTPKVTSVQGSLEKGAADAMKSADYPRAMSLYEQLYDRDEKRFDYQVGFAESLRRMGQNQAAVDMYEKALAQKPDDLQSMEGKGLALMALGDKEEASKQFKKVMDKDSKRWRTLNALGILFVLKDMNTEGLAYFNEALNQNANSPSIMNNIGLVQAMEKNYPESITMLKKASRLAQGDQRRQVDLNLALVYGISGNMADAKTISEHYLQDASLTNNLGLYAHLAHNDELAKSYLNMALNGSSIYYDRAWKNLDIIANESKGEKDMSPEQKSVKIK